MRFLPVSVAAAAAILCSTNTLPALMVAFAPPYQRALSAETVVIGKVASIEAETVEVEEVKGGPKTTYKVALVKVESGLKGADGLTHIKVGFIPQPAAAPVPPRGGGNLVPILPNRRAGRGLPELQAGQEMAFFLTKHQTANFQVMNFANPPLDLSKAEEKQELESVKKTLAVIANPKAALTSDKVEDRYFAACTMLLKYRQAPRGAAKPVQQAIPAEENALILKGLTEGDWDAAKENQPSGTMVIGLLGLNPKEGFQYPKIKPGQKPGGMYKQAFTTWLKGPGKDYAIKTTVSK